MKIHFFCHVYIVFTYCDHKSLITIAGADSIDCSRQGPLEGNSYLGRISEDGSMSMPYYIIAFTQVCTSDNTI